MKIFNHVVECNFRAKRKWTDPVYARREYYTHFVIGKFSLFFGQPHLEPITVCAHCNEPIEVLSAGDECWNYCEGCQQTEGDTAEMTMEEFEALQ